MILAGTTLDQWITVRMENLLASPEGASNWIWAYGAVSLFLNLTYPLLGTLLVLSTVREGSVVLFLKKHFTQNVIEEMRAWGKTMAWSFLFLVPGLIRFLQYFFVPFVVSLNPAYEKGELDALEESRRLAKGRLLALFGIFLIFSVLAPAFLTIFDDWRLLWKTPVGAVSICFVELLLNLWFIHLLFQMYQRGAHHESPVSVERH